MGAPVREAARVLYELREADGWDALEEALGELEEHEIEELLGCWQLYARESQLRPAGIDAWMIMAGRGFGKTRSGAEDTLDIAEEWGPTYRGLLASKAYQRDIEGVMVYGESGLMACAERRGYELEYVSSKSTLYFPHGGIATLISADNPEAYRGPQFNHAWLDEIAKWKNPVYAYRNIKLGMRLKIQGAPPKWTITTTPKRNSPIVMHLVKNETRPKGDRPGLVITGGTTRENIDNLDEDAVVDMETDMAGTSFGAQELEGKFFAGVGTMTSLEIIDRFRVQQAPPLGRRIVSFDPAVSDDEDSDDHGIIVLGEDTSHPRRAYVLSDRTLAQGKPEDAAERVVLAALEWSASSIVVEVNQGGQWVESMLRVAMDDIEKRTGRVCAARIVPVWAHKAKEVRAEPVGALYELGRCPHVGRLSELETEASTWIPGMPSPNRMDALVHGVSHLLLADKPDTLTGYA